MESVLFSFYIGRNVIISEKQGKGKTSLALWVSEYFKKLNGMNIVHYYLYWRKYTIRFNRKAKTIRKKPFDKKGQVIVFEEGILTNSNINGKICIILNIDQLQPNVTEILNSSLNDEILKIEVPENPEWKNGIEIHKNYRL